eukprot:CAMPEP_0194499804 /NCGR_PEP_ID=MMETSP0253-20130528/15994_1 /TAXON_ID=2966 /ORGANISM="Noctiluca scintillans" /LENGTH=336 /DNA_ID=CAMNT_0039341591 /DNA_START=53 /DNA_END=1063 /DNA_ORIENTATION=+
MTLMLRDALVETHPVQLAAISAAIVFDVVVLHVLNKHKRSTRIPTDAEMPSWTTRRNSYWAVIATCVSLQVFLDIHYELSPWLLCVKSYAFAFPIGLLDLFFSQTRGVPMKVLAGAALWSSTVLVRQLLLDWCFGITPALAASFQVRVVRDASLPTLARELFRYVLGLPIIGILSDMIFSPFHRLMHHPALYQDNHKIHHQYTNKLTSLVLYHGTLLDDFMMPVTTAIGGFVFVSTLSLVGLQGAAFSSITSYLVIFHTLMSHAHDTRCARLMAPLPDSLNFVAYHYVHHLSPCNNFGLTKPSDLIWDTVLGVRTIRSLEDFEDVGGADTKKNRAD